MWIVVGTNIFVFAPGDDVKVLRRCERALAPPPELARLRRDALEELSSES